MGRRPLLLALLSALPFGCWVRDPDHCANLAGNASCKGRGGYCSTCQVANHGCTDRPPNAGCGFDEVAAGSSTGGTDGSGESFADESSSTGPVAECTREGAGDPACPEDRPLCSAERCVASCAEGASSLCRAIEPETPVCHPEWETCVQCLTDDDCGHEQGCDGKYACRSCFEHDHCPDSACNMQLGTAIYACMDDDPLYFVGDCQESGHPGTEAEPICGLGELVELMETSGMGRATAWLDAGDYLGFDIGKVSLNMNLVVLGRGAPRITSTVTVTNTTRLVLANLMITDTEGPALVLDGTATGDNVMAVLHDVRIERARNDEVAGDGVGVVLNGSRIAIHRSIITDNDSDGIRSDDGDLTLWSSIVSCNGNNATHADVRLLEPRGVDIRAATVGSPRSVGQVLVCTLPNPDPGNWDREVRSSVFVSHGDSIDCEGLEWSGSVVDTPIAGDVRIVDAFDATWFASACDLRLGATPEGTPLAGVATWQLGDPRDDVERDLGTPVPGARLYAGADQP